MNKEFVQFQLTEASGHLSQLRAELEDGTMGVDDEPALAVQLGHIFDHLSIAWNGKDQSIEHSASMTQEEFERLCNTVPNFMGTKIMGEFAC